MGEGASPGDEDMELGTTSRAVDSPAATLNVARGTRGCDAAKNDAIPEFRRWLNYVPEVQAAGSELIEL
jgi:hypothetical protein